MLFVSRMLFFVIYVYPVNRWGWTLRTARIRGCTLSRKRRTYRAAETGQWAGEAEQWSGETVQCTVSRRGCKTSRRGGPASSYVSAVSRWGWLASSTDEARKAGSRAGEAGQWSGEAGQWSGEAGQWSGETVQCTARLHPWCTVSRRVCKTSGEAGMQAVMSQQWGDVAGYWYSEQYRWSIRKAGSKAGEAGQWKGRDQGSVIKKDQPYCPNLSDSAECVILWTFGCHPLERFPAER